MVPVCCMYSLHCKLDLPVVIDFMYLIMILLLVKLFFLFVYFQCVVAKVDADAEKELGSKYLSPNYITILIRINNWPESYLTKHGHQIIPITFCNFFLLVECPYASHSDHKSQPKNYFKYILNEEIKG